MQSYHNDGVSKHPQAYASQLQTITSQSVESVKSAQLKDFVNDILQNGVGIVTARPLLTSAVKAISELSTPSLKVDVGTYALTALETRIVSFEEQDAELRYVLADAFTAQEEWVSAAKVLQGIQLESSQRKIEDHEKVQTWIRICRLYLEEDNTMMAETYLNRAKTLLYKVDDPILQVTFQLSQARILDSQRKFLDASSTYHNISLNQRIDEDERLKTLSMAITCAILAPAGPQRSRSLAKLYKDDRATQVEEYGMLEKMFFDRLLTKEETEKFAANLAEHQLARTSDGNTVLAKAVIEHNLLSASCLYNNIDFDSLGQLLNLSGDRAEEYASAMLQQGRVKGRIDQINSVIHFDDMHKSDNQNAQSCTLVKWNQRVQGLVEDVERIASAVQLRQGVS